MPLKIVFLRPQNWSRLKPITAVKAGSLISVRFGSVSVSFGSVLGPFRVRLGVLGRIGVGVVERGFCKAKVYH